MTQTFLRPLLDQRLTPDALTAALHAMPVGISWASLETKTILDANRAFLHIFGYQPREFHTLTDWVDTAYPFEEDRALAWEPWSAAFTTPGKSEAIIEPMELRVLCKDGSIKNILHGGLILPATGWGIATFVDLSTGRRARPAPLLTAQVARASNPQAPLQETSFRANPWESPIAERKRQSEALRISAELLDRTGRLAGVGGWEVDLIKGTVSWTTETHRIHGVPPGYQPTLNTGLAFYASEARHMIRNVLEEAIGSGAGWDVEAPLIRADGERIWVRTQGFVEVADGRPVRLMGAIQDITARVTEQNALKKAKDRLVLATASAQIGTFDWDITNLVAVWDDRMYRLYGLDPAARNSTFEAWSGQLHPEDRERAENTVRAAVERGGAYEDEFRAIWPDGTIHHIRAMGQATHDDLGRPVRMIGVTWDVTEQRRLASEAEQRRLDKERADQEELFRITLESIGDGVITTAADTRVTWMNPVAERLTGWQIADAAGLPLNDIFKLIHEETRELVNDPLAQCLAEGRAMSLAPSTLLVSRDGREIGIDDSAAPIRDARGVILGVVLVFHNVTEQRHLAREARRMLKLDLQMKDDFLSHVSHELRSPLASIYSFANILADGLAGDMTPSQKEYLDIILKNSRQLRSMIEDLLQVTRSETGKLSIALQATSLAEAVSESINTLHGGAHAKGIKLTADCPTDLPPAEADPIRLRQVLIIILDNATKFTPVGGAVHLTVRRSQVAPGKIQVSITDTGCGIDPEAAERIFEHLYQVSEPGQEGRRGLGLGLYIARDLVLRQGGAIWVESEVGQGSTFHFTLPICFDPTRAIARNPWGVERRKVVAI